MQEDEGSITEFSSTLASMSFPGPKVAFPREWEELMLPDKADIMKGLLLLPFPFTKQRNGNMCGEGQYFMFTSLPCLFTFNTSHLHYRYSFQKFSNPRQLMSVLGS